MYPVLLTLPSTIRHAAHNDMNVTLMSLQRHQCGIDVVCGGQAR
jgi:hypothetical protein